MKKQLTNPPLSCIIYYVAALDTIKRDIPNAAIVAAVVKVTGVVPLEEFKAHFESSFAKKELVPANMEAIDRAYEEVQQ